MAPFCGVQVSLLLLLSSRLSHRSHLCILSPQRSLEIPGVFPAIWYIHQKYSTVCRHITADIKNTTCVTDISRCVFLLLLYGLLEYFDPVYFPWELYGSRCAENLLEMMRTLLLMDENLIFPELFSQVWTFLWLIEFASQYFVCQYSMWEFNGESWNLLPQLIVPLFQVS